MINFNPVIRSGADRRYIRKATLVPVYSSETYPVTPLAIKIETDLGEEWLPIRLPIMDFDVNKLLRKDIHSAIRYTAKEVMLAKNLTSSYSKRVLEAWAETQPDDCLDVYGVLYNGAIVKLYSGLDQHRERFKFDARDFRGRTKADQMPKRQLYEASRMRQYRYTNPSRDTPHTCTADENIHSAIGIAATFGVAALAFPFIGILSVPLALVITSPIHKWKP